MNQNCRIINPIHLFGQYGYATSISQCHPLEDEIVIYPDCYPGNMFKSKKVVRFLLNYAGYFGQDKDFPKEEMMYYYSPELCLNGRDPENILSIPTINEEKFRYRPDFFKKRMGSCYLAIKYEDFFGYKVDKKTLPPDCIGLTKNDNLEYMFQAFSRLITFDNSAINLEAAFAGVDVEFRFNQKFQTPFQFGSYFKWSDVHTSYDLLKRNYFTCQLPDFVNKTMERFL